MTIPDSLVPILLTVAVTLLTGRQVDKVLTGREIKRRLEVLVAGDEGHEDVVDEARHGKLSAEAARDEVIVSLLKQIRDEGRADRQRTAERLDAIEQHQRTQDARLERLEQLYSLHGGAPPNRTES